MNGAPANPISGRRAQLAHQRPDGRGQEVQAGRVEQRQRVDVGHRADRLGDDRADAGLDLDVQPGDDERQHDVGEEDRGVHPVPADRLQGDLGDQVGVLARLEHRRPGAQRPVLRQRPAGLAHEPDRGPAHRQAAGGADEVRVGGQNRPNGSGATVTTGHSPRRRGAARRARRSSASPGCVRRVGRGVLSGGLPCARGAHQPGQRRQTEAGTRAGTNPRPQFRAALDALARRPRPARDRPRAHPRPAAARPLGARGRRAGRRARPGRGRRPRDRHRALHRPVRPRRATRPGTAPPAASATCRRPRTRNSSTTRCSPRSPGAG